MPSIRHWVSPPVVPANPIPVSSRLALRIRDQERLGPVASSRLLSTAGAVPWAITLRVRPAEVERAVAVAKEELARLRQEAVNRYRQRGRFGARQEGGRTELA